MVGKKTNQNSCFDLSFDLFLPSGVPHGNK